MVQDLLKEICPLCKHPTLYEDSIESTGGRSMAKFLSCPECTSEFRLDYKFVGYDAVYVGEGVQGRYQEVLEND